MTQDGSIKSLNPVNMSQHQKSDCHLRKRQTERDCESAKTTSNKRKKKKTKTEGVSAPKPINGTKNSNGTIWVIQKDESSTEAGRRERTEREKDRERESRYAGLCGSVGVY